MKKLYITQGGEFVELDSEFVSALVSANNPKAQIYTEVPYPPHRTAQWNGSQWVVDLAVVKAQRIDKNRAECKERILARYPLEKQLSALAGVYPSDIAAALSDWVSANVAAENAAADAIDAATTLAAVEAVTVAWPT